MESGLANSFCPKYLPIIKLAASPKIAAAKSSNTMTWMFMPPMAAIPPAQTAASHRVKWRYDQTGFAENHNKQNRVNPRAVLGGEVDKVLVDMEDEIDNGRNH